MDEIVENYIKRSNSMVFGFEKIMDIAMYIHKLNLANLMETVMNKIKWSTRFFGHSVQKDKS